MTLSLNTKKRALTLLSSSELMRLPQPPYLIDGLVEQNSLSVLYGPPGMGKSFIAMDMAIHIALGRPWCDRPVRHGQVIYVAAEGYMVMAQRLRAWCKLYECEAPEALWWVTAPINLTGGWQSLEDFLTNAVGSIEGDRLSAPTEEGGEPEVIEALPLQLIVFDTLSRCIAGMDENDSKEMSNVVSWLDTLRDRETTGLETSVMLVHHSAKHHALERGSSALRGAADTMMYASAKDGSIMLRCSKQKGAEAFEPIEFTIAKLDERAAVLIQKEHAETIAPGIEEDGTVPAEAPSTVRLGSFQLKMLTAIAEESGPYGITITDVCRIIKGDMPHTVRAKTALLRHGFIMQEPMSRAFKITRPGLRALKDARAIPLETEGILKLEE